MIPQIHMRKCRFSFPVAPCIDAAILRRNAETPNINRKTTMKESTPTRQLLRLALILCVAAPLGTVAQSDNFNSGTLDPAWKRSNFNPALVNLSFPDAGDGKALRIQSSPVPNAAPAAAMFYRDEVYTDFHMGLDVVDWPGTDKNQAIVLVARATLSGNPAATTGIIMNYDASQYGENPTDRRQGQFQINMVTNSPAFGTKTLSVAEITLQPGRPYRFIFQGVGSRYTGKIYDLHDLTKPLVTIEADDDIQGMQPGGGSLIFESGFKSGVSGILSFSRQGQTGTTDVTVDNYFAGPADPNPATGTALAHPVPGTPTIDTRVPAERFKNFHNPADGISFTAKTYTDDVINAGATKLRLNGADRSSQLVLPANGTAISVSLPGSALAANTIYSAQIEVEDVTGTKRATNTFWFDTFSDAYLSSAGVKTIEAEDYNFSGGEFMPEPIRVSGITADGTAVNIGGGYWGQVGLEGIDFHDNRSAAETPWDQEYRSWDAVGITAGMYPEISDLVETSGEPVRRSDNVRAKYAAVNLLEYVVHRTEPGEWLNYTRTFQTGSYAAYLRVASFGQTEVELHRVTSDPKQLDQTTTLLGTFRIPNQFARYNYRYIPLVNEQGANVLVNLSGQQTLRLQMAGTPGQDARKVALNYILLFPQAAETVKLLSSSSVTGTFAEEAGATINTGARTITIPRSGNTRFYVISAGTQHRITTTQIAGDSLTLNYE
jgi:hypothetical protein